MSKRSTSTSMPKLSLIFATASFSWESVFSPKKSILMSPVSSITWPSYCVHRSFSPVSLSSAVLTGTQSSMASRQMIVPQACTPVLRTLFSNICANLMVSLNNGSGEVAASFNSGIHSMALRMFIFLPLGSLSGMALQRAFTMPRGTFCTRPTSLMASLVAIVPYVMI